MNGSECGVYRMLTANETAALYWQMLAQQSGLGLKSMRNIPVQLRKLAPLRWCVGYKYQEDMCLLEGWYSYCPEKAQETLRELEFDIVRQLHLGYRTAQSAFCEVIVNYLNTPASVRPRKKRSIGYAG